MSSLNSILRVGITGNIGSGKSTVCRIFALLGIPVYYADEHARRLMIENDALVSQITALLGQEAYLLDGQLNRPFVASVVFSDKDKLEKLNALVHPAVGIDGEIWHQAQEEVPYTLYEAALLYESGGASKMDAVVVVSAPEEVRISRVMARDHVGRDAVLVRIKNQWPEEQKTQKADYVIANDGSESLLKQVWELHQTLSRR